MATETAKPGRSAAPPSGSRLAQGWRAWRQGTGSCTVSACVHAIVLITLGMLYQKVESSGNTYAVLEARLLDKRDEPSLESLVMPREPAVRPLDVSAAAAATWANRNEAAPIRLDVGPVAAFASVGAAGWTGPLDGELASGSVSARFFGIASAGDTFVFVVDGSGSMAEQNRLARAKAELEKSIRLLQHYQRYYVIFFSDGASAMPGKGLQEATEENIAKTVEWLSQIEPDGFTNPLPALQIAESLKPDAIFFLSDGAFDPITSQILTRKRTGKLVPIHTIAFTNRAGERVMQTISALTKGTYRFVP